MEKLLQQPENKDGTSDAEVTQFLQEWDAGTGARTADIRKQLQKLAEVKRGNAVNFGRTGNTRPLRA